MKLWDILKETLGVLKDILGVLKEILGYSQENSGTHLRKLKEIFKET
jgi:hypothetical protein